MARGTQHLKKRPRTGQAAVAKPVERPRGRPAKARRPEEAGMFFPMLRRQAKWVFVLLALVFAGGFVLFGVGSGSNGLGNVLQDWLNIGQGSSGPSVQSLEAKTREHPDNAQAWRQLATAAEGKQAHDEAIQALERYTALRPKDDDALQELASLYQAKLQTVSTQAQELQLSTPAGSGIFAPPTTSRLGQAFADTGALGDPIEQARASYVSQQLQQFQQQFLSLESNLLTTYEKVVALDPTDATSRYQLARIAQGIGDRSTALKSYRAFLRISPDDPLAPTAKQAIKQLTAASKPSSG